MLTKPTTHYEALEIAPDASPHEVREAYLRLKNAYNKDSVALYTLVSADDREEILTAIEDAYRVLSDPEKRKEYDRCHEQLGNDPWALPASDTEDSGKERPKDVVSIDRVPPMENSDAPDSLLIPPRTDARDNITERNPAPSRGFGLADTSGIRAPSLISTPERQDRRTANSPEVMVSPTDRTIAAMVEAETEWSGETIRKIREIRIVSIEDMAAATKISKTYLTAVEAEEFAKLPAAVFTRGFVMQICRLLKIPQDKVVPAYMARFNQKRGN